MGVWRAQESEWNPSQGVDQPSRWPLIAAFFGAALFIVLALAMAAVVYYGDRFMPGVTIEGRDIGGLTRAEVTATIRQDIAQRRAIPVRLVASDPFLGESSL